jgi:signal transduction histidine kinase
LKTPNKSLTKKLYVSFIGYSTLVALLFSLLGALYIYSVEDAFFENILTQEKNLIINTYNSTGVVTSPTREFIQLLTHDQLPEFIQAFLIHEPSRIEFYAEDQKHYHLRHVRLDKAYYLLADVTDLLVVRSLKANMLKVLAIAVLLCLIISLLLAFFLVRKTISPLKRLTQDVIDSETNQNLDISLESFENDEVGYLAGAIQASWTRSQQFLNREKSFTRDVSHELRTPLAIIRSSNDLIKSGAVETLKHCTHIDRSVLQMEQIITSLLSLARESSPKKPINPIRLLPLIEQSVIDHSYHLDSKEVEVSVEVSIDDLIHQEKIITVLILNNLISNAFQYTPNGEIKIQFKRNVLTITNTAPPLQNELKNKVFEPLVKGESSSGFGLGLSLVKRLCEKYQMECDFKSKGTIHSVSLKL